MTKPSDRTDDDDKPTAAISAATTFKRSKAATAASKKKKNGKDLVKFDPSLYSVDTDSSDDEELFKPSAYSILMKSINNNSAVINDPSATVSATGVSQGKIGQSTAEGSSQERKQQQRENDVGDANDIDPEEIEKQGTALISSNLEEVLEHFLSMAFLCCESYWPLSFLFFS
jgi:hypothetical protein